MPSSPCRSPGSIAAAIGVSDHATHTADGHRPAARLPRCRRWPSRSRLRWPSSGPLGNSHLHTDLEEAKAERVHLRFLELGPVSSAAELVHEYVGCGVEQEAKLVRPESMAAQPVGLQDVLEILDGVLTRLGARHVAVVVEIVGTALERGHDEADVGADRLVLRLDEHAIRPRPSPTCTIARRGK